MSNDGYKEVYFNEYCEKCINYKKDVIDDKCDKCLSEPTNLHSHKPVDFIEKGK